MLSEFKEESRLRALHIKLNSLTDAYSLELLKKEPSQDSLKSIIKDYELLEKEFNSALAESARGVQTSD